jgi:3-phenylpropionate/cinnamic acid dioxygenase small subunit
MALESIALAVVVDDRDDDSWLVPVERAICFLLGARAPEQAARRE